MKTLKLMFAVLALCLITVAVALGADAVTPALVVAPPAATVSSYFAWFSANWGLLAALWLVVEQILAATSLRSNSTFQIVCNVIDGLVKKPVA